MSAVSILHLSRPFEEQKGLPLSPDSVSESSNSPTQSTPSPSPTHFLKGGYRDRFQAFFVNRVYTYKAKLAPKIGKSAELKFRFPLIPYLQQCVDTLRAKGVKVKRVLLKGGAVHRILTGSQKPLSDLDVTIEIEQCKDWSVVERLVFEPLSGMAGITWNKKKDQLTSRGILRTYFQGNEVLLTDIVTQGAPNTLFFTKGAKDNAKVVNDRINEFGLYTIPSLHNGNSQKIDLQVSVRTPNACFCSLDSIQINLGDLDQLGENPYFESVGGYDLEESLDLMAQGKFKADAEKVEQLYEGPRGFCRIFTRGYYPADMHYEKPMWESYLQNHRRSTFQKDLEAYLANHFSRDPTGKIFYLLNYYEMFSRCPVEMIKKENLERIILEQLYTAAKIEMPEDFQQARVEIEAIQAYFYLRTNDKTIYSHQRQKFVFLKTPTSDYLLFRAPGPRLGALLEKMEKNIHCYPLLHHLADDPSHLLIFFKKRIGKEIEQSTKCAPQAETTLGLIDAIEDPHFSPPVESFEEFRWEVKREIFELLKNKSVINAYKVIIWALEQKGLIDGSSLLNILQEFCSMGSMGMAERLIRYLAHRKERGISQYLYIYSEHIADERDAQKLLELISLTKIDAESLLASILQKYPHLIGSAMPLLQNSSPAFHRKLGSELTKKVSKQSLFVYFDACHQSIGTSFFVDEGGKISLDSIEFYLERLISKNQMEKAVSFYKEIEPFVLSSDAFAQIYTMFLLAACSEKSSETLGLISNGLQEIIKRGAIDEPTFKALALLAKYPQIVKQTGKMFTQVQALVEKLPKENETRKNEILRIMNATKQISKSTKVQEEKKTAPPITLPKDSAIFELGKQFYEKKQYRKALQEFLKIKSPSAEILFLYIFPSYREIKNIDQANKAIQKAIDLDPENQEIWGEYFLFCQDKLKLEAFHQTLEKKCKDLPKSTLIREIWIKYLQVESDSLPISPEFNLIREFKLRKRAHLFNECREIEPKDAKWANNYGAICVRYGNYNEAMNAFKQAIKLDPQCAEAYKNLACAYIILSSPRQAIKILNVLIGKIENKSDMNHETANAYAQIAECHKAMGEFSEADECYKKAFNMRIDKQDHSANVKYAQTLFLVNKVDDAIKCLTCSLLNQTKILGYSIELFGKDFYHLGQYYMQSSKPDLAAGAFEQALLAKFEVPAYEYTSAVRIRLKNNLTLLKQETDETVRDQLKKIIHADQTMLTELR